MVSQLIADIAAGRYTVELSQTFAEFVSKIREINVSNSQLCFVLLHLHETPTHRQRLIGAWEALNIVVPSVQQPG